jgi:DNA polymerase-1
MRLVFDIETDGLDPSKVWCISAIDVDTSDIHTFTPTEIKKGLKLLSEADELIGHNIMGYDLPALKKLYGFEFKGKVTDTLVMTRLIFADIKERDFKRWRAGAFDPKLIGSHSLKAWGRRLGEDKGDFGETTDWSEFTQEMLDYCVQDTKVNVVLLEKLEERNYSTDAIELEHEIHRICLEQEWFGFPFDVKAAVKLYAQLTQRATEIHDQLSERFTGWWENKGEFVPKRTAGQYFGGCPLTKIKWTDFNPNSREHIAKKLMELGWEPDEFTETQQPKIDETVLKRMSIPEAALINEYLMINKRIGQLAEGKQAWLKLEKDGYIHGRVNTMGTVTSRCTHSNPNTAQIPSVRAPYGRECRELFYAPKGYTLLGMDMSGLELRCLAHFTAIWDKGSYAKEILSGDIHTANQKAAGLATRDQAKTFIYGFLYGSGDAKTGEIIGKGAKEGAKIKAKFLKRLPAIKNLRDAVAKKVKENGYLTGIDGRHFPVRSDHAAVNVLLQGTGAILCKRWVVEWHKLLTEAGYTHGDEFIQAAFVHDEVQMLVKDEYVEDFAQMGINAIKRTGQRYKFRIELDGEYNTGRNWAETH